MSAHTRDVGGRSDTGVRVPVCEVGVRGSVELCLSVSTSEMVGCEELSRSVARRRIFTSRRDHQLRDVTVQCGSLRGSMRLHGGGAKGVREWIYGGVQGCEVGV